MNIATWLQRSARIHGPRPAVATGTRVDYDYAALADTCARTAGWLQAQGVAPGDRVGLFMDNCAGYLAAMWSVWWAGAVAVPMNARLHGREAAYILDNSGAALCLCDTAHAATLAAFRPDGCRVVEAFGCLAVGAAPCERGDDDAAWLFYTSGTTGKPKGVTISARNLRQMSLAYTATVQPVAPGDACLHPAPLSHGSGLYHLPYVMNGGVNVVPASGGLDNDELFALAAHWRHASLFAAPTIVRRLAAHARALGRQPEGFATIVCGGAPMYVQDMIEARQALGPVLAQIYGQGESPMTITVMPGWVINDDRHPDWRRRLATVGFAQPMVEVAIRDEQGAHLPTGTPGEVCVRGDVVMAGYWRNPDATAAAIRDGWLYTGDVGSLDADGFLTLLDRSKDLLISGGNNIYPREVEETLLQHPAVAEVAVIGRPDPEWGESVVAYVVATAPVSAAELDRFCLDNMARYKRPKFYRMVDQLPKNHYGKVLKTELRQREAGRPGQT